MSSKTVALGIVIGASLGRGYFSVFDSAKIRADKLGQAFAETNKKLAATRDVEKYRQQLVKLQAEQQKTGHGAKDIQKVSKALEKAEATAKKYGLSLGDIAKQQRQLAVESGKLGRAIQYRKNADNAQQNLSDSKGRLLGVVGAAYVLAQPIKEGVAFEHQLRLFGNVVNFNNQQLAQTQKELNAIAKATNQTPGALLEGLGTLSAKGLDPEKSIKSLHQIGKVSTAYAADVNDLSTTTFSLLDNMGIGESQIPKAFDLLAQQGKSGSFEMKDMARYFPMLTAQARSLKMHGLDATATLGAALQIAMKGAADPGEAANNLKNFLAKLTSPETVKKFKEQGVSIERVMTEATQKGIDPMVAMVNKIQAMTGGNKFKMGELFGDMQVLDFLNPMLANLKEFERIKREGLNANGVIDRDFVNTLQTSQEQLKALDISAGKVGNTFATHLLPGLNLALKPLVTLSDKVDWLVGEFPTVSYLITGIAGGFIAYGAALTTVTAIQWAFNSAMAANPIGMVVSGVAAFAALAYTVYENWAPISLWIGERVFTPIASAADKTKTLVGNAFAVAARTVKALWEPVMTWFAEKFAWIGQSIAWVKDIFNQSANASMRPVGATQKSPFGATASATAPLPGNIATPKGAQNVNTHNNTTINVQQKTGENSQDLAKRVAAEIKRQENSDKRRALHD